MNRNSVVRQKIKTGGKTLSSGKITQVIGPVVDVEFGSDAKLPEINNALIVYKDVNGLKTKLLLKLLWNLVMVQFVRSLWNLLMD